MTSKIDSKKDVMYTLGAWFLCTHLEQGKRWHFMPSSPSDSISLIILGSQGVCETWIMADELYGAI